MMIPAWLPLIERTITFVRDMIARRALPLYFSPMSDKRQLKDLRSVGPATVKDFQLLGITSVAQLKQQNAQTLYDRLCKIAGQRMDPCVLDVFSCAIAQAKDPQLPSEQTDWWFWSKLRKQRKR